MENNNEQNGDELIRRIEGLKYRLYWFCNERYQPDNFNRVGVIVPGADANMICFPVEHGPVADLMPAKAFSDLKNGKVPLVRRVI